LKLKGDSQLHIQFIRKRKTYQKSAHFVLGFNFPHRKAKVICCVCCAAVELSVSINCNASRYLYRYGCKSRNASQRCNSCKCAPKFHCLYM